MTHFDLIVEVRGHQFHVSGDIQPAENPTWNEYDGGTPGCPECIEDMTIFQVHGKRKKFLSGPKGTSPEQRKAWSDFCDEIESEIFEAIINQ